MKRAFKVLGIALMVLFVASAMSCDFISNLFGSATANLFGAKLAPEIATNAITFDITAIGSDLRGYDSFPTITLFVAPRATTGELITGMQAADFFDTVDDNGTARNIVVTPPRSSVTSATKTADIVFVIDTTGSMGSYLTTMTSKAQSFADAIAAKSIDYRLGFVTFGDDIRKGTGQRLAPTSNITTFKTAVGALVASGGGDALENQIDALDYARAAATGSNPAGSFQTDMSFTYRSGAMKIFILITDIGFHTPSNPGDVTGYYSGVSNTLDQEIAKLKADSINCYVVGPAGVGYESLASGTDGEYYSSGGDFSKIIDKLGTVIAGSGDYMITFMTQDFTASKLHKVRVAIHTRLGNAQAIANYTSPSVVNVKEAEEMYAKGLEGLKR